MDDDNNRGVYDGDGDNCYSEIVESETICEGCDFGDDGYNLVLCDGCPVGWHVYCLRPKLPDVPKGEWFCPACTAKTSSPICTTRSHARDLRNLTPVKYNENRFKVTETPGADDSDTGERCAVCDLGDDGHKMLMCDGPGCEASDTGYHIYCLKPKLSKVPRCRWFCPKCSVRNPLPPDSYEAKYDRLLKEEGLGVYGVSIDAYAGCGIGAKVMTEAGFNTILAIEKDEHLQKILHSVLDVTSAVVPEMGVFKGTGFPRKSAIIAVGLPCPGHSNMLQLQGKQMTGIYNQKSGEAIKFLEALRITAPEKRPDCLFIECTQGILKSMDGAHNEGGFLWWFIEQLYSMGYSSEWITLRTSGDNSINGGRWVMTAYDSEIEHEMRGVLLTGGKATWDGQPDEVGWGLDRLDPNHPTTRGRLSCPRSKICGTSYLYRDEKGKMRVVEVSVEVLCHLFGIPQNHVCLDGSKSKSKPYEILGNASRHCVSVTLSSVCDSLKMALKVKHERVECQESGAREMPPGAVPWRESAPLPPAGFCTHSGADQKMVCHGYTSAHYGGITFYPKVSESRETNSARDVVAKALLENKAWEWKPEDVSLYLAKAKSRTVDGRRREDHLQPLAECIHGSVKLPDGVLKVKLKLGNVRTTDAELVPNGHGRHILSVRGKTNNKPVFAVLLEKKNFLEGCIYGEGFGGVKINTTPKKTKCSWEKAVFKVVN